MRTPRKSTPAPVKTRYFIADKEATEIAGVRLTPRHFEDGIELFEDEARHFVAGGALTTVNPNDEKTAQDAVSQKTERTASVAKAESDKNDAANSGQIKPDPNNR